MRLALLVTALVMCIIFIIILIASFISDAKKGKIRPNPMRKFDEYRLAGLYQMWDIDKVYKNVIKISIPLIILTGIFIRDYVIREEITKATNNNFEICIDELKKDADLGELFNNDMVPSIVKIKGSKEAVLTGSYMLHLAAVLGRHFGTYSMLKSEDYDLDVVMTNIDDTIDMVDSYYSKFIILEDTNEPIMVILENLREIEYSIKDSAMQFKQLLTDGEITEEEYADNVKKITSEIPKWQDDISLYAEQMMKKTVIESIILYAMYITGAAALFRILGICRYYIKLKKFRKGLVLGA